MLSTSDPALVDLLESGGTSLVVCVVTPEGEPFATRGWGIQVMSEHPLRVRLTLPAGDLAQVGRRMGDPDRFAIAVTGADVATLRAVQVKGSACGLEEATPEDLDRFAGYCAAFFRTIQQVDGHAPELLRRIAPADLLMTTVEVEEIFDQTPGPQAGAPIVAGVAP